MLKVLQFIEEQKRKAKAGQDVEELLPLIHHKLMFNYGYISLEDFRNMPIVTVFNLMDELKKEFTPARGSGSLGLSGRGAKKFR